jgi:molybdate-binding protein/DNA-binding XRE family transcriptional regulator
MIMSGQFQQHVQRHRRRRNWSQEELARRAGLSRAAISAIETGRVVPSTAAALALATAIECRVEELFSIGVPAATAPTWAWPRPADPWPFWRATVAARTRLYPVERTAVGSLPADGIARGAADELVDHGDSARVIVLAGCDPAVGLLRTEVLDATGFEVLPLVRSSRRALDLLREGLVHVAGLHLNSGTSNGNADAVRTSLGPGYTLLRVTQWEEGIAFAPHLRLRTVGEAAAAKLRWVAREEGSGARDCLDAIFRGRRRPAGPFAHVAADHLGVVETIRSGWAEAGVTVRLCATEAGLGFLTARRAAYDLCYRTALHDDPCIRALRRSVQSKHFRRQLAGLPGYRVDATGALCRVSA